MQTIDELDPRFYISESTIPNAGRGLFARTDLEAGEDLPIVGVLIQANSTSDSCTHFADAYKFRFGDHLIIPMGYAAMVNHSGQAPNMEKYRLPDGFSLRTLRPIAAGDELFIRYSTYYQMRYDLNS